MENNENLVVDEMERLFIDEETGECIVAPILPTEGSSSPVNNAETGEPEVGSLNIGMKRRRVPFQIPREVKDQLDSLEKEKRKKSRRRQRRRSEINDEKFIDVEPVSGTSFAQTNPIFLFLVAIVYFRWILALLTIFEVVFHIWTHHKNKRLKDSNVFFRSPFHGVTSEFCALCQNENCMDKVGKMQEIRMHKFLRECNYMKRAVT